MVRYTEEQFSSLLSEFIVESERSFNKLEQGKFVEYSQEACIVLYECMLFKIRQMISQEINPKEYGFSNIFGVNVNIKLYRTDIARVLALLTTKKEQIELLESLRKCNSIKDVMNLYKRFIEVYSSLCHPNFISTMKESKDEGLLILIYIIYLGLYGAYAFKDSLYDTLNVYKKGFDRPRYDFLRNGLPLGTKLLLYDYKEYNSDKIVKPQDLLIKVEKEFTEYGHITCDTMANFNFIAVANNICKDEFNFMYISREKFKAILNRYIDILENSVLAFSENHINISYEDYSKVESFNNTYKQEIENTSTIDEVEVLLEKYKDDFSNKTEGFRKVFCKYAKHIFQAQTLFSIYSLTTSKFMAKYITKKEVLVILSHTHKLRSMLIDLGKENLESLKPVVFFFFISTEERIIDLKNRASSSDLANVSTKKINKKIAKYKKVFDFKDINKLAEEAGFEKIRQNGDHGVFKKFDGTTVIIPQGRTIGKGLSYKIQRDIENSKLEAIMN